jgi:2TM domain
MSHVIHHSPTDRSPDAPAQGDQLARQQAIKQIERRRRFWISTIWSGIAMLILVAIWAATEYHNAGGWPVHGFGQSSGLPGVWNFWIVYPLGAWLLIEAAHAWAVFGTKPISESEIKREIERRSDPRK